MENSLKGVTKRLLYSAGYYRVYRRLKGPREPRFVILMYHDIGDDAPGPENGIRDRENPTASQFSAHVEQVARNYRILSVRDAVGEMHGGGLQEDTVAFTFDDGYASVFSSALPALKRWNVPATLFVLTGWINREVHVWWLELRALAARCEFDRATTRRLKETVGIDVGTRDALGVDARGRFLAKAEPWLRALPDAEVTARLDELRAVLLPGAPPLAVRDQALTWGQIVELADQGVELGAHTHTHVNLRFADAEKAQHEIDRSRAEITQRVGGPVVGFAYPYGKDVDHYATAEAILRSDGFDYACSALPGVNSSRSNPFSLRRITLPSTTSAALINRALSLAFLRDA